MLATVGVPPTTATAPPLTRILPAASRLIAIVLSAASPNTVSTPALNVAVVAALAGTLVAANTPAASTAPASSRRAARRQPLVCLVVIVPPLSREQPAVTCGCPLGGVRCRIYGLRRTPEIPGAWPNRPCARVTTCCSIERTRLEDRSSRCGQSVTTSEWRFRACEHRHDRSSGSACSVSGRPLRRQSSSRFPRLRDRRQRKRRQLPSRAPPRAPRGRGHSRRSAPRSIPTGQRRLHERPHRPAINYDTESNLFLPGNARRPDRPGDAVSDRLQPRLRADASRIPGRAESDRRLGHRRTGSRRLHVRPADVSGRPERAERSRSARARGRELESRSARRTRSRPPARRRSSNKQSTWTGRRARRTSS